MTVPYADVSASDLRLNLVNGNVDLSTLKPISHKHLTFTLGGESLQAEIGILGASHYMRIATYPGGDALFTEVFACKELSSTEHRLYAGPLGPDGRIGKLSLPLCGGRFEYSFDAHTEQWENEGGHSDTQTVFRAMSAVIKVCESLADSSIVGLQFDFPGSPVGDPTVQPAATLVLLRVVSDQELRLETLHSYPNERLVVRSTTTLKGVGE